MPEKRKKEEKTEIFARRFSHLKNAFRVNDGCSQGKKNEANDLLMSEVVTHISPGSIQTNNLLVAYLDTLAFRKIVDI